MSSQQGGLATNQGLFEYPEVAFSLERTVSKGLCVEVWDTTLGTGYGDILPLSHPGFSPMG